nr:MAG TPA: hypothetical protein [Caudoviricetes sp.]
MAYCKLFFLCKSKKAYQPRCYSKLIGYLLCYSVINNCFTTDN